MLINLSKNIDNMKSLRPITYTLLMIGGINWLLVVLDWDIAKWLGGADSMLVKVIYVLVGVSALLELYWDKME